MKRILALAACVAVLTAAQNPHRKFQKNYELLQAIGATSPYRDAKCFTVLDRKYPHNCMFFADSTREGHPIIWADMYKSDGTLWFEFTISEAGSTLTDKAVYTKAQRKCARHFYRTLSKAAAQKK